MLIALAERPTFGDTDQAYQATSQWWAVNFAYPTGGDVLTTGNDGNSISVSVGYAPDSSYGHLLIVKQYGPAENPIDARKFVGVNGWEASEPLTFDGAERTVAVKSESNVVTSMFGFETPDGHYRITVKVGAESADPCPVTYANVGRRVLESVEPQA